VPLLSTIPRANLEVPKAGLSCGRRRSWHELHVDLVKQSVSDQGRHPVEVPVHAHLGVHLVSDHLGKLSGKGSLLVVHAEDGLRPRSPTYS